MIKVEGLFMLNYREETKEGGSRRCIPHIQSKHTGIGVLI